MTTTMSDARERFACGVCGADFASAVGLAGHSGRRHKDSAIRQCTDCGEVKPIEAFPLRGRANGSRKRACKVCYRAKWKAWRTANVESHRASVARYRAANPERRLPDRLRRYGLTVETAKAMLEAQDRLCAICKTAELSLTDRFTHVDHCHATGKVRALLCLDCNLMLGRAYDNPARLRAAADFLERHQGDDQ